jgi:hypothetical protein
MADLSGKENRPWPTRSWLPVAGLAGLLALLIFQSWAYYFRLPISLGPRVILQPWLQSRGFIPYEDIQDLHTPLMPLLLQAARVLVPDGLILAKLAQVGLLFLTTLLAGVIGWRKIGWLGGLWAAWFVVVWSPTYEFGKLWHESFLAPLYLLLWLLYDDRTAPGPVGTALLAGLVGGAAVLVKQHAAVVLLAFVLWSALTGWAHHRPRFQILRGTGLFVLAASLPAIAYALYQYLQAGTLRAFLYWTIGYTLTGDYGSLAARSPTWSQIGVIASSCLVLPLAVLSLVDAVRSGDKVWLQMGWGLLLIGASSVTLYPRFDMFHLQAALPVLGLVSSLTGAYVLRHRIISRPFVAGILLTLSAYWFITAGVGYRPALITGKPPTIEEYTDLVPIAQGIRRTIGPSDCVYIFPDSEASANLYYLLKCPPPTFLVFHYPWYMLDGVREGVMRMMEDAPPEWIASFPDRWDVADSAPEIVQYIRAHYSQEVPFAWQGERVWLLRRQP